jgi:hypothetical protein
MGTVEPLKTTMRRGVDAAVVAGDVGIIENHGHPIICEICGCTNRRGLGLVRDWQPTSWFCGPCLAERLDPL